MLYLDIRRALGDRGINDNPAHFLQRHGFTDFIAAKMVKGRCNQLSMQQLEKLCIALNCGPTELFSWKPGEGVNLPPQHPLYKRVVTEDAGTLGKDIRELSPEKMEELRAFVKDLKGKQ